MRIAEVVRRLRRLKDPESVDYVGGYENDQLLEGTGFVTHFFGAHTIDNGGIHMAARRAGASGMRALQFFTAIPKFYGDKSSMKPERAERFRGALAEANIDPASSWRTPRTCSTPRRRRRKSTRARGRAGERARAVDAARDRLDLLSSRVSN